MILSSLFWSDSLLHPNTSRAVHARETHSLERIEHCWVIVSELCRVLIPCRREWFSILLYDAVIESLRARFEPLTSLIPVSLFWSLSYAAWCSLFLSLQIEFRADYSFQKNYFKSPHLLTPPSRVNHIWAHRDARARPTWMINENLITLHSFFAGSRARVCTNPREL